MPSLKRIWIHSRLQLFPATLALLSAGVVACALLSQTAVRALAQEEPAPDAPAEGAGAAGDEKAAEKSAGDAAAGEPSNFWLLDFELKSLRMISPQRGLGSEKVYWYMLYTLSNPSKESRETYLQVSASSDHEKEYADLFLPSVEKAIERKENAPLWGKTDLFETSRKKKPTDPKYSYTVLKPGEKRACVAVFNRLDPNANKITIRVAGLSNEIREIAKDDGSRLLEERVREFQFERPGDEHAITLDSFKLIGKDWVKKQTAAVRKAGADKVTAASAQESAPEAAEGEAGEKESPEQDGTEK